MWRKRGMEKGRQPVNIEIPSGSLLSRRERAIETDRQTFGAETTGLGLEM